MEAHKTGSTMMGEAFAILMVSSMATISPVFGFQVLPSVSRNCLKSSTSPSVSSLFSSWSETDDWSALSEQENTGIDSADFFSRDFVGDVARSMEAWQHEQLQQQNWTAYSEEDLIINEMVDAVQHYGYTYEPTPGQPHLYDNPFDESSSTKTLTFEDEMGQEISMLVRCSESPEEMLIGEGIALPPLTEAERNDLTQLLAPLAATPDTGSNNNSNDVKTTIDSKGTNELQPSTFLLEAASKMFAMHASATGKDGQMAMDGRAIANWMQRSLGTDEPQPVRPHDPRVLRTLTSYSDFGAGYLTEANFQNLYVAAVRQALNGRARKLEQLHNTKEPSINTIFRDIRNHGIQTPVEVQRKLLEEKMRNTGAGMATTQEIRDLLAASETIMDECELVDGGATIVTTVDVDEATSIAELRRRQQMDLPSHTTMEFADDGTTPLWVNEGDHVFISEEACIGCTQCVLACPESFAMLENGKARTYKQRSAVQVNTAIATCPVDCMHKVSYEELKKLETARDHGVEAVLGSTGGSAATATARRHRKLDMYHYLQTKCYMSKQCPQKGCYQCPMYRNPGENPNFQRRKKESDHIRAESFQNRGISNRYRKYADL